MPGFATSAHTKTNAIRLMEALGVTWQELDIRPAAERMLADIGHPFARGEPVYDLTFENVQAGLRTDYLFRLANHHNGIVIGTGDLSELALGWCTYGVGDQMSHYNVNAGVPKTLIQHLIRWVISARQFAPDVATTLDAILATEITPELVPAKDGRDAAEHRGDHRPLRAAGLQPVLHAAPRLRAVARSRSWRCTPGATRRTATGRPAFRRNAAAPTTWRRSASGWRCSCAASSRSASSSARRCRTARRSAPAARCRRAATGARRPTAMRTPGSPSWNATCRRGDPHFRISDRSAAPRQCRTAVRLRPDHRRRARRPAPMQSDRFRR